MVTRAGEISVTPRRGVRLSGAVTLLLQSLPIMAS
jgi:hypothetical protein